MSNFCSLPVSQFISLYSFVVFSCIYTLSLVYTGYWLHFLLWCIWGKILGNCDALHYRSFFVNQIFTKASRSFKLECKKKLMAYLAVLRHTHNWSLVTAAFPRERNYFVKTYEKRCTHVRVTPFLYCCRPCGDPR